MQYVTAILSLLPYFKKLLDLFIKTPEQERAKFLDDLNNAFKKATELKDPSDLSRLINGL